MCVRVCDCMWHKNVFLFRLNSLTTYLIVFVRVVYSVIEIDCLFINL